MFLYSTSRNRLEINPTFKNFAIAAIILFPILCPQNANAADVSEARSVMAQFNAELKSAFDARAAKDTPGFNQHQQKAQELLVQARRLYEEADAQNSKSADVLREYAEILMKSNDTDLAQETYAKAAQITPNDPELWRGVGRACGLLGSRYTDKSLKAFQKSIELETDNPQKASAFAAIGRVYRQEGLYDLSREAYEKAIAIDPDSISAKIGLIGIKIQNGAIREASDELDALGNLPPEHEVNLPELLSDAVARFQESRRAFSDAPENHIAYAKLLYRVGATEDALNAAQRSAQLAPDAFSTWNFIGDLNYQLGRNDNAKKAYQHSLELKPDQPVTRERLDAMSQPQQQTTQTPSTNQ